MIGMYPLCLVSEEHEGFAGGCIFRERSWHISTPNQAIQSFLRSNAIGGPRTLNAATLFAESMVHELKTALKEWEMTVNTLQTLERRNETNVN